MNKTRLPLPTDLQRVLDEAEQAELQARTAHERSQGVVAHALNGICQAINQRRNSLGSDELDLMYLVEHHYGHRLILEPKREKALDRLKRVRAALLASTDQWLLAAFVQPASLDQPHQQLFVTIAPPATRLVEFDFPGGNLQVRTLAVGFVTPVVEHSAPDEFTGSFLIQIDNKPTLRPCDITVPFNQLACLITQESNELLNPMLFEMATTSSEEVTFLKFSQWLTDGSIQPALVGSSTGLDDLWPQELLIDAMIEHVSYLKRRW